MKICKKCGEEKEMGCFYRHPRMADGHLNFCKECVRGRVRKHRSENDSVREYDRRRYHENEERRRSAAETVKRWNLRNPEGYRAHYAVSNAIRDGRLIRMPCEICGEPKSHAHHEDYSKPFEITWLCVRHHALHHANLNSKASEAPR